MNAIACPSVGSRMSPRGSFGFGSITNLMSYPWSMTYSDSTSSPSAYRWSATLMSLAAPDSAPSLPPQKT